MLIECQGDQHFKPARNMHGKRFTKEQALLTFNRQRSHDAIKRQYCTEHKFKLVEIRYKELARVPEILTKTLGV
jgi:hypothetical protein